MIAIKVYCPRCTRSSKEYAFTQEHVNQEERRCPQPARNGKERCNGRLCVYVDHTGRWA